MPCGRELTFPGLGEGAAPHSPVTFQVGHFLEPRCLLMSWGERLSALYPSSGPHITRPQEAGPGPAGSGFRPVPCASQACRGNWHTVANQVHLRELGDSDVTGSAFPEGPPPTPPQPPASQWGSILTTAGWGEAPETAKRVWQSGERRLQACRVWVQVPLCQVASGAISGRSLNFWGLEFSCLLNGDDVETAVRIAQDKAAHCFA